VNGPFSAIRLLRERQSQLLGEASRGDPEALDTLLSAARSVVHDWAAVKTRDPDDAEDVTQLVLMKLFTRLPNFRGESKLSSWLYRITLNEVSGFYKKRDSERKKVLAWVQYELRGSVAHPDPERIDRERVVGTICKAAETLPPLQSSVFKMVDLHGMRPCEAARELGTTQTNTRSSLSRARKKIRELVRQARRELVEDLPWEGR
jgi:RNA polymerase sigma-70 factor (ECF subfamily)